ncbi:MAG: AAA domain-containing protein [Chloroflexota bacterium]|nr:AAA domain-containing protein [Chloroflexota bacterium]
MITRTIISDHHINDTSTDNLVFIKDVAKYFMDFLETDFHKRRNPKRTVRLRSDTNLLVGIDLNKYPTFQRAVWKTVKQGFESNLLSTIAKGTYRANIPADLLELVIIQKESLSAPHIDQMVQTIAIKIEGAAQQNKTEYDKAMNMALENVECVIKSYIVRPLIQRLSKPLKSLGLGDENTLFLMEDELTNILLSPLEDRIANLLRLLIAGESPDVRNDLALVLNLEGIKSSIQEFFEGYHVKDLYAEIYEIDRNRSILDKQETYLYFYDIAFQGAKYPIFYVPFSAERQRDTILLTFDSQVYINKKALEYVAQEYNTLTGKKGSLNNISERIVYLAHCKGDFLDIVDRVIGELVSFFDLDSNIIVDDPSPQIMKSAYVKVSNSCYINLSDKSDEALINDYEEILQLLSKDDTVLGGAFNRLVDDFIHKEPVSFNQEIEDEWDDSTISDRLVFKTPIPLNSEQRQILKATQKEGCKYITVEGPPGTGKSHTITAIVFNAILKNQSVLVLSDKKEALDVVEDKITQTMDQVRFDKNFQNPILRLGKTGNTYSQILSSASIQNIKTQHRVVKKEYHTLTESISKSTLTLREDLEAEVLAYGDIHMSDIQEFLELDRYYQETDCVIDLSEVSQIPNSAIEIEEFRILFHKLQGLFADETHGHLSARLLSLLETSVYDFNGLSDFCKFLELLAALLDNAKLLQKECPNEVSLLSAFADFSDSDFNLLDSFVTRYKNLKNPLFGYFLKGAKVQQLDREFRQLFRNSCFEHPHKSLDQLNQVFHFLECDAIRLKQHILDMPSTSHSYDYLKVLHGLLTNPSLFQLGEELVDLREDIRYLQDNLTSYPNTLKKSHIDLSRLSTLWDNHFLQIPDHDFDKIIRYISLDQKIADAFSTMTPLDYGARKKEIEKLVTLQMTHLLDERVVDFYENNRSTATALRNIIRNKERFPKDEFTKLKDSFPCILSGIRDYAEYIPLAPDIFDLVIIDEASQVSIAQAFPALLRAKKVIVLGDKRQFSNVKAIQARSDTNKEYLNRLENVFRSHVSQDQTKLNKLRKFNIKTSILEFFDYITNFDIQLMKYFRGYKEIISYSNKYFYQDSLQVMKIRGKPIDDVLRFTPSAHDGKKELAQNTNVPEIKLIISELNNIKKSGSTATVGIITPHTNQQKLAMDLISKEQDKDFFFDTLKLKIMTFDTCQGEERDIVFYSMVATVESDHLWGVFIKDLDNVDLEEEGKIKAQRLNVGFSRARECMHFVLSKPLERYSGAIGEALRHYNSVSLSAREERTVHDVDPRSPMEAAVLNWFYQTEFWKENREFIEFIPGFEMGKYLRQLDKSYTNPAYVVDFLLIYHQDAQERKIIIEYDGFKEHFQDVDHTNNFQHDYYYSDLDVYREKVIESYGYRFLRINKFNIGKDPIATLHQRLMSLVKDGPVNTSLLAKVCQKIEGLQNGSIRQCPKCKEIRNLDDFRDRELTSGWGKICNQCKAKKRSENKVSTRPRSATVSNVKVTTHSASHAICPKCGSYMVLREGRYGTFWSCSRFPYCRGTRRF